MALAINALRGQGSVAVVSNWTSMCWPNSGFPALAPVYHGSGFHFKRWSLQVFAGSCATSKATTLPIGLSKTDGGKYWGGIRFGYDFISKWRFKMGVDMGIAYRDYGFAENKSSIPYTTALGYLKIRQHLFWKLALQVYGGAEYGKVLESTYVYNDGAGSNKHNLFLHKNDAIMLTAGGGLCIYLNKFQVYLNVEQNLQNDSYDLQYGKTIGGQFASIGLNFYLF